jgi:hypothetical protein
VQISKAPAPITPVRGTGYSPNIKQPEHTAPAQPIDWKHWRLMPLEPWQASALSLRINPENMQHHPQAWMGSGVSFIADSFPSRDVEAEFNKRASAIERNLYNKAHFGKHYGAVSLQELAAWCICAGYDNLPPELVAIVPLSAPAPMPAMVEPAPVVAASSEKPWLIACDSDPAPSQPWYSPARYFARQLVIADSTLLTKRGLLAEKVSLSLANVGIKKRGGKLALSPDTVLKAFANINFG